MSKLVYLPLSGADYVQAMRNEPPRITSSIAEDLYGVEHDLLGGRYLLLTGEIPPIYYWAVGKYDMVLGFRVDQLPKTALRIDYACLQEAYLIAVDEHCALQPRELQRLRENITRSTSARDTAIAVERLNPQAAVFTGVRTLELIDDISDEIRRINGRFQPGFNQILYSYFDRERAMEHEDRPLSEPAYFRRLAERTAAA